MKLKLILMCLIFTEVSFSQIPIGKDILKGKTEFITYMQRNGFTLLSQKKEHTYSYNEKTGKHDIPAENMYLILFKEEVEVDLFYNKYSNINRVIINPENTQVLQNVLRALKFENWEYLYEKEDFFGITKYYKVKSYYAYIPDNKDILQIHFVANL